MPNRRIPTYAALVDLGTSVETVSRLDGWASTALAELADLDGVHRAGLAVIEGGGRRLLFTASDRPAEAAGGPLEWCHIDSFDDVPLTAATRHGRLVAGMLDDLEARYRDFAGAKKESGSVAVAAIPLTRAAQVLGGCVLYFDSPQRFDARRSQQLVELGAVLGARLAWSRSPARRTPRLSAPVGQGRAATYEVPPELAGIPAARESLRRTLREWGVATEVEAAAALCLSEMVTNTLIHTDGGCQVQVHQLDGTLCVRVHDLGHPTSPRLRPVEDDLQIRGRGLQIVEATATRSGRDEVDAVSWFEIDL